MPKFTNMYYSQYESSIESEVLYNSDNSDTRNGMRQSPSHAEFYQYIDRRNKEEEFHKQWQQELREREDLAQEVKEQCGMAVKLQDNYVCYIYKPDINETHIPGIKFKITLEYVKLLRKWYFSLGHSRLPDLSKFHIKMKKGTYNPIEPRVLEKVRRTKSLLEIFVHRLTVIYQAIDKVEETYKDIEFQINEALTKVKVLLKEKGWPKSLEKMNSKDIIVVELTLDENIEVENLEYELIYNIVVSKEVKKMCIDTLEEKLRTFFDLPLMEAFQVFLNGGTTIENESFDE